MSEHIGWWKWERLTKDIKDELIALGFDENKPLDEQYYMKAPPEIRNMGRYFGVSEKDLYKIRPALLIIAR